MMIRQMSDMNIIEFVSNHKYRHSNIGQHNKTCVLKHRVGGKGGGGFATFEAWFCKEYGLEPLK